MIGNSPKSDINPALAGGLHAVFIPHAHTWVLEHEVRRPGAGGPASAGGGELWGFVKFLLIDFGSFVRVGVIRLKVKMAGGRASIILPKTVLARSGVSVGDTLFLTESTDGFCITSYDPELEEQMTLARNFMRQRREALRELAK